MIVKFITGRTDSILGNLGVTRYGQFRFFDPDSSMYTEDFHLRKPERKKGE
jgi:isocitrate dehydrogenase kinase/phosphatase